MPSVVAAMIGLCVLLLTGVLSWTDCLSEKSAWDTLAWFAVLIGMSAQVSVRGSPTVLMCSPACLQCTQVLVQTGAS